MTIHFEKASQTYADSIFAWLEEPHVKEFWDNSKAHKNDIRNFINGRKKPSKYCYGLYNYWIGCLDGNPFCMIMTLEEKIEYDMPDIKKQHISNTGNTYSLDYMIGEKEYYGKGLGAKTLRAFIEFFKQQDPEADTFFIDPDTSNPRAKHVYLKAGFEYIADFIMRGTSTFKGREGHFLIMRLQ